MYRMYRDCHKEEEQKRKVKNTENSKKIQKKRPAIKLQVFF